MRKVLIFIDWFEPGFKAGGPIRSAVNFVNYLKNDLDLYVFTSDRDLGDTQPYPGVITDQWINRDGFRIFYAGPKSLNKDWINQVLTTVSPDYIYLNSMFSRYFTIYPLISSLLKQTDSKVILAPRGMLRNSALAHKALKKTLFIRMFRLFGVNRKIRFQATDETELNDIRRVFPLNEGVELVPNLPGIQRPFVPAENKSKGFLKLIFVGRVHPIKNLDLVLQALQSVRSQVEFTIVAATDDKVYGEKCRELMKNMPSNIRIHWLEDLPHAELESLLISHHVFILPTKGENFGHSIFESLAAGRPVIISDQTPWRDLAKQRAGVDISLNNMPEFSAAITRFAEMDAAEHELWCRGAWDFCHKFITSNHIKTQYLKLFN